MYTLEGQEGARGSTYAYQHHKAFSVGYYVSCSYNNALSYYKSYRGEDCIAWLHRMCILDISKTCLYEFHYEYMKPLYRNKCRVMYTDTDSLVYLLECEDAYGDMKRDISKFDTSDYSEDNVYGMPRANKKIPDLMKDENNGAIMTEFVGLRAKMYATRVAGKNDTKKIKGVKKNVVAKTITFDDFTRCLHKEIELTRRQSCIRSKLHEVYTVSESKLALSPYDDKRHIVPNSADTLPWGHYSLA